MAQKYLVGRAGLEPATNGFERFVATGEPTESRTMPEPTDIDLARVAEVCAQFDIQVLGPPPAPTG
ncbi:hypothetical protein [Mycolicibacterium stellerae]|uniref:hypothetical protein n=1 Tax=Mycolicibacterium stellerae TaxID=2358193 RepID=UPI0013DE6EA0|nr:hypothetical protein [Mycolicibacterium stellerae]